MGAARSEARQLTLGLVQMSMVDDPGANLVRAREGIREAAGRGAQVVVLPELFRTPYFCRIQDPALFDLAEPIPGPVTEDLGALAASLQVVVVAPYFEEVRPGLYYNTVAILDADGRYLGKYRKTHIPQDPGFEEKFYFTPGDLGCPVFQTRYGRLGVLICWDQWYPEAARLMALGGAELLVYPTAIGRLASEEEALGEAQHHAWQTVQCGHAVANGCFVAAVNRVGTEAGTHFWGGSFVANAYGQVVAKADSVEEQVLIQTCDLRAAEDFRRIWPFFRDRRVDLYGGLCDR